MNIQMESKNFQISTNVRHASSRQPPSLMVGNRQNTQKITVISKNVPFVVPNPNLALVLLKTKLKALDLAQKPTAKTKPKTLLLPLFESPTFDMFEPTFLATPLEILERKSPPNP